MAKAAVGQICSSASMAQNLEQCVNLVSRAAAAGAKILFLPEASDYIAPSAQESLRLARPVAQSPFVTGLQSAAAKHQLAVHVGIHVPVAVRSSITAGIAGKSNSSSSSGGLSSTTTVVEEEVKVEVEEEKRGKGEEETTKLYNRTILIDADGTLNPAGSYDKLHLFDYANLRESASTQAGKSLTPPIPSPAGRLGSLICFDLRFPEPALALARPGGSSAFSDSPAQVLLYPSAFTVPTGRAHWEVLLRARAIETGSWVVAAAQVGRHAVGGGEEKGRGKRVSYGRSLVVDPWGRIALELKGVAGGGDDEPDTWEAEDGAVGQLGVVDIDLGSVESVRERMPLRRRTDVYPEI